MWLWEGGHFRLWWGRAVCDPGQSEGGTSDLTAGLGCLPTRPSPARFRGSALRCGPGCSGGRGFPSWEAGLGPVQARGLSLWADFMGGRVPRDFVSWPVGWGLPPGSRSCSRASPPLSTAKCSAGLCFNGGSCVPGSVQPCHCPQGFQGPRCQYDGECSPRQAWAALTTCRVPSVSRKVLLFPELCSARGDVARTLERDPPGAGVRALCAHHPGS